MPDGNHITRDQVANTLLVQRGEANGAANGETNGKKDGEERDEEGDEERNEESEAFAAGADGKKWWEEQVSSSRDPKVIRVRRELDEQMAEVWAEYRRKVDRAVAAFDAKEATRDEVIAQFQAAFEPRERAADRAREALRQAEKGDEEVDIVVCAVLFLFALLALPIIPIGLLMVIFILYTTPLWYACGAYLADVAGRIGRHVLHKMGEVIDVVVGGGWWCVLALVLQLPVVAGAPGLEILQTQCTPIAVPAVAMQDPRQW